MPMKYVVAILFIAFCCSTHAQSTEAPSAPDGKEAFYSTDKLGNAVCKYQKGTQVTLKRFDRVHRKRRKSFKKTEFRGTGCPSF